MRMKAGFSVLLFAGSLSLLSGGEALLPANSAPMTDAYKIPSVCGRYGWQGGVERYNGQLMMFQNGHTENTALWAIPWDPKTLDPATKYLADRRMQLFKEGKLPAVGGLYDCWWKENLVYPTDQKLKELAANPAFMGFRCLNEWGTQVDRAVNLLWHPEQAASGSHRLLPFLKKYIPANQKEPATREEYVQFARFMWEKAATPLKGQIYVLDGSHNWAKAWPGGWGPIRAIITENRVPYRNNLITQMVTRSAARTWHVPYGYLQAFDWHARIGHPTQSHMTKPRDAYRNQTGKLKISPSLYRRLWYYQLVGNAAYLGDESDHVRYADWSMSGNTRLSWYGELCEEIRKFNDLHPDLGQQYNPIGLLISWHNGWAYRGDKAFYRFPYDEGEHMTRELIHRGIFQYSEMRQPNDEFSATPYGDIFDLLRFDTPKGPLPQELLCNYRVLMLVGKHNLGEKELAALREYVKNGGVLVVNAAQFPQGLPEDLTGASLGKTFSCDSVVNPDGKTLSSGAFSCSDLKLNGARKLYTAKDGRVIGSIHTVGKGRVITMGMHWMLEDKVLSENNVSRRTMIPAMDDLLTRLGKEALPFELVGNGVRDQLAFQVNKKPNGFVIAIYNNAGLIPAEKVFHGYIGEEIVDIHKTIEFAVRLHEPMYCAVNLLKNERIAVRQNECKVTLEPGELVILEFSKEMISAPRVTRPVNLAYKKKVSGDRGVNAMTGARAVDGKEDFLCAWWSEKACPASLIVDLKKTETVNAVRVLPAWSENNTYFPRISQWVVETSVDGKKWDMAADESKNIMPNSKMGVYRRFPDRQARYVRYTELLNSSRQGGQLIEIQVFGTKMETVDLPWKLDPASLSFPAEVGQMLQKTYLSGGEIPLVSSKQDEKVPQMDKECYHGGELSIRGRKYAKGIGTHAKSELVFKLDPAKGYRVFTAYAGIDDVSSPAGTVDFQIFVDGKKAFSTGKLMRRTIPIPVWADVTGAKELKLVVDDCGDGINGDIADWADACLRK